MAEINLFPEEMKSHWVAIVLMYTTLVSRPGVKLGSNTGYARATLVTRLGKFRSIVNLVINIDIWLKK